MTNLSVSKLRCPAPLSRIFFEKKMFAQIAKSDSHDVDDFPKDAVTVVLIRAPHVFRYDRAAKVS